MYLDINKFFNNKNLNFIHYKNFIIIAKTTYYNFFIWYAFCILKDILINLKIKFVD